MIIISEKLNYNLLIKIICNKLFFKKKNKYFYLENNKSFFAYLLNKNFFLVKQLKWDLLLLKNDNNKYIYNKINKKIYLEIITKIMNFNKVIKEEDYYFNYFKYRFLQKKNIPYTNKTIFNYLIIFYSINNIFNKKKFNNKVYLFLDNFIYSKELVNCLDKLNIEIKFINRFKTLKLIHLSKTILKKIINKFLFIYYYKSANNYSDSVLNFKNKIIVDLPLQMNDPNHFFSNKINKDPFLLINKSLNLSSIEYKKILKSNISFYEFDDKKYYSYKFNNISFSKNKKQFNKSLNINFSHEKKILKNFFLNNNTFVYYVNSLGYDHSIPACSAINELNGVSVFSQTSFHDDNSVPMCSDIFFTFSSNPKNLLINQISRTKYIIEAGYVHDYNFKIFKNKSFEIKNKLLEKGVKKIVTFFDQGHNVEATYDYGYRNSSSDYEFILKKLIQNPWMGLILKPKKPGNFFAKINKINHIFLEAKKTGRVYINLETDSYSVKDFGNPPCACSMASDISIHSTPGLNCTAGLESYLSGTPVIFLDKQNHLNDDIKNTSDSKVVFNNWLDLWESLSNFLLYNIDKKILGNLNQYKNKIDKFNDGNASLRILNFLNDLNSNRFMGNKNKIIEYTVDKYADKWGKDKISKIK